MKRKNTLLSTLFAGMLVSCTLTVFAEELPEEPVTEAVGEEVETAEKDAVESKAKSLSGKSSSTSGAEVPLINIEDFKKNDIKVLPDALNTELLGDSINFSTGELSFRHVDVDLPGNSALPVRVARTLSSARFTDKHFGRWQLEIPRMSIRILRDATWWDDRCSNPHTDGNSAASGQSVVLGNKSSGFYPLQISIPGVDNGSILTPGTGDSSYFGEDKPDHTTLQFSRIECVSDSSGNETFSVTTTNGDVYTFDKIFTFPITKRFSYSSSQGSYGFHFADLKVVYPSEVKDVHGNWVRYEYSEGNKGPVRIHSNDLREITIEYSSDTSSNIVSVTANERTWTYATDADNGTYSITRPDGQAWEVGIMWGVTSRDERNCQFFNIGDWIKHPNGIKGSFEMSKIINFRSGVPDQLGSSARQSCLSQLVGNESHEVQLDRSVNFFSHAVTKKTLTFPDETTYEWQYQYEDGDQFHEDRNLKFETHLAKDTIVRTAIEPTGRTVKSHFSTQFVSSVAEGTLVQRDIYESASSPTPLQSEVYEYTGFDDPFVGAVNVAMSQPAIVHATPNYPKKTTITMHTGDVYTTEYVTNSYGHNTQVKRSSTVTAKERITDTTFEHNTDKWILGLPKTITQNDLLTVENDYNEFGKVTRVEHYGQLVGLYSYYANGLLKTSKDGELVTNTEPAEGEEPAAETIDLDRVTEAKDWKRGTPQQIVRADGTIVYQNVDNNGWLISTKDALLRTTTYTRDKMGRVTLIEPHGTWFDTAFDYDFTGGGLTQTITRGNYKETTTYDALLRPILNKKEDVTTGSEWEVFVKTDYDAAGRITFKSYPSASAAESTGVEFKIDALNRQTEVKENAGAFGETKFEYLSGNKVKTTDPGGYSTTVTRSGYGSSDDGEILSIASPESVNTSMTYDDWGNITALTQSGNQDGYEVSQTHKYYYDDRKRLCRHSVPELGDKLYAYDNANQVVAYAEGQASGTECAELPATKVSLTYDKVGQVLKTDYPGSTPDVIRTYDDNGNLKTLNRGESAWTYVYFDNNLIRSENLKIDGLTFHTYYTRDGNGHLTGIGYPSSDYVKFSPDALGRATEAAIRRDDFTLIYASDVEYHLNSTLKSFTYGNDVKFTQGLNERLLPNSRYATFDADDTRQDPMKLDYTYDGRGNTTTIQDRLDEARDIVNTFDGLGRLKTSNSGRGHFTFTYDATGNLRRRAVEGGTPLGGPQHAVEVNFNTKNQVSSAVTIDGSRTFTHDARGNVTSNGLHNFVYDYANQPISISGGKTGSFVYDGNLKRVKQTVDRKTIYSVYTQGAGLVSQYDKTNAMHTDHIRVAGTTVARTESKGSQADPDEGAFNGTLPASTETQTLADRPHYLPYGKSINGQPVKENAISFTGHIEDTSGLVYMQARYYDPVIGRFYSNDPVGALSHLSNAEGINGFNRYSYAVNNPYKYTDPNGQNIAVVACGAGPNPVCLGGLVVLGGTALYIGVKGTLEALEDSGPVLNESSEGEDSAENSKEESGKRRKNRIPDKGEPNTSATNPSGTTIKIYGEDGWVEIEWNDGHGDNAPEGEREDHVHDHESNPYHPDGRPNRQPGRKPTQEDLEKFKKR